MNSLLAFILATFMSLLATNLSLYAAITYLTDFGAPDWMVGLYYYVCFAPFLVGFSWVGRLTDRVNKKHVLITALLGLVITMGAQMLLTQIHSAGASFVGVGVAFGLCFLFVPSCRYGLIADCFPNDSQGRVLMLTNTSSVLAMSAAPLLQSTLRWLHYTNQAPIISAALILIAALIYSRITIRAADYESAAGDRNLPSSQQRFLLLTYCALGICMLGPLQTMLPKLVVNRFHFSPIERDMFMALLGVGIVFSVPLTRVLSPLNHARELLLGLALSGLCLAIAFAGSSFILGAVIVGCAMVAGSLVNLTQMRLQSSVPRNQQGQLMARLAMVSLGVPAAAAGLLGGIATRIGTGLTFMALSAMLALGFIALEILRLRRRAVFDCYAANEFAVRRAAAGRPQ